MSDEQKKDEKAPKADASEVDVKETPDTAAQQDAEQKTDSTSETEVKETTPEAEIATEEVVDAVPSEEEIAAQAKEQAEAEALPAEEVSIPDLRSGMTVRVHQKIQEGEKERIQVFQGMIIAMRGKTPETKTITVMKVSFGVRVEKIFPLASPLIEKIEVVKIAKVRRAKLYYLKTYRKRLKETLVN